MKYPIIIHKDPKSSYGVTLPDFKGCFTSGETLDKAIVNVQEAVECHLDGEDVEIPTASTLEAVSTSAAAKNGWLMIVDIDLTFLNKQTERINITVPQFALQKIDKAWKKAGAKSRSTWLTEIGLQKAQELGI